WLVHFLIHSVRDIFPGHTLSVGGTFREHWYMGAMATPRTAGHTGFTGTSLVLDPTTDSFLIVLGNSVHPVRSWRSGSAPRVATANQMARAVAVRPARGRTAWFSGMASAATATLALPPLPLASSRARLSCALWWDTEPASDFLHLEASTDAGATWQPVPFTTTPTGQGPRPQPGTHPDGSLSGWSGRVWHRLDADLAPWRGTGTVLRWRYTTDQLYVGRGVYVDAVRVEDGGRTVFDESRPGDARLITAEGWAPSAD
ncbi:serine hydrolase, partial [Streptomyces sp. NPDC058369]